MSQNPFTLPPSKFWHWPDKTIGKRESRRLREEHNRLANSHSELLQELKNLHAFTCRESTALIIKSAEEIAQ